MAADARARVMSAFDVGPEELDELVGDDPATLAALDELAAIVRRKLASSRIPDVARRPARAYAGRSMLDAVRDGDVQQVLSAVRGSFQWDRSA